MRYTQSLSCVEFEPHFAEGGHMGAIASGSIRLIALIRK